MSSRRLSRERLTAAAGASAAAIGPAAQAPRKTKAAGVSIISNGTLIALKLAAGAITGSIAIVTEALHSGIDLVASVVAYYSLRKADEPADESHPYGHQKVENLAAAIEGMLILVGAGIIVYAAVRHLAIGAEVESLGVGLAVIAFSAVANLTVSSYLYRQARLSDSPALASDATHLRTDAATSAGVLVALVLVQVTGVQELDPAVALVVAVAIVLAGIRVLSRSSRVLVDEALPATELDAIRHTIAEHGADEVIGFHKLRARRAGSRRYVDLHVQFRDGTTLKRAHDLTHELQRHIGRRLGGADVLIHLEPEEAVHRPERNGPHTPSPDPLR
jgi:cation diffusion facilitator family transporter